MPEDRKPFRRSGPPRGAGRPSADRAGEYSEERDNRNTDRFRGAGTFGERAQSARDAKPDWKSKRGESQQGFRRSDDQKRGEFAPRGGDRAGQRGGDTRRVEEPDLPDDIDARELDRGVRQDLLSLDKTNAEAVAKHLLMASRLVDDEPGLALAHARAARQRAGRIAVVRETVGIVAYHAGEWAEALAELRAAKRMSGGSGLLAVMADCERGLGRPERAIELGRSTEAQQLTGDEATELRIVVAGARMDLSQYDQAVVTLQTKDLDASRTGSTAARLFYAYADALVAAGRTDEGRTWFLNAAAADLDDETDAEDRAAELTQ